MENQEKQKKVRHQLTMIDPPSGWKYGFPKPLPEDVKDVKAWLIDNGYPEREIDVFGENFICRRFQMDVALGLEDDPFDSMDTIEMEFLIFCMERKFAHIWAAGKTILDLRVMYPKQQELISYLAAGNWNDYVPLVHGNMPYAKMIIEICKQILRTRNQKTEP